MKKAISRCFLFLVLAFPLIAPAAPATSHYLFVWAMQAKHPGASTLTLMSTDLTARRSAQGLGNDFLAVFDVRPGASFGKLVTTLRVGEALEPGGNRLAITGPGALATRSGLQRSISTPEN